MQLFEYTAPFKEGHSINNHTRNRNLSMGKVNNKKPKQVEFGFHLHIAQQV